MRLLRSAASIVAAIAILAPRSQAGIDRSIHQLAINQIGYATDSPKRFTAPLSPDGTPFIVRLTDSNEILHRGAIQNQMFPFNPEGAFRHAEGWVNYGASWCISLSYLKNDAKKTTPAF